jgi:hypothetical protein
MRFLFEKYFEIAFDFCNNYCILAEKSVDMYVCHRHIGKEVLCGSQIKSMAAVGLRVPLPTFSQEAASTD